MRWNEEKLQQLPMENGFYLRGNDMTRIETFVAAAFAFCITLIMISGDEIPSNIEQTKKAVLSIPAFLFAGAQIIWIWYAHARWSKRFGLEDAKTIMLSGLLLMLVLVYVYPMRMMASGMFYWISGGFFKTELMLRSYDDLRFLFYVSAIGLALLGCLFWFFQRHALGKSETLQLTPFEIHSTLWEGRSWLVVSLTSLVVLVLTAVVADPWISFAPTVYGSLAISLPWLARLGRKNKPQ